MYTSAYRHAPPFTIFVLLNRIQTAYLRHESRAVRGGRSLGRFFGIRSCRGRGCFSYIRDSTLLMRSKEVAQKCLFSLGIDTGTLSQLLRYFLCKLRSLRKSARQSSFFSFPRRRDGAFAGAPSRCGWPSRGPFCCGASRLLSRRPGACEPGSVARR